MRILVAGWGCFLAVAPLLAEAPPIFAPTSEVAKDQRLLGGCISGLATKTDLSVFQGLPHRMRREWFAREEARQVHFDVNQASFYRAPIVISAKRAEALDHILTDCATFDLPPPDVFRMKACIFHADWAVRWTLPTDDSGTPKYAWALICFGCDDVQFALASDEFTTVALTTGGRAALSEQLSALVGPLEAFKAHRRAGRAGATR